MFNILVHYSMSVRASDNDTSNLHTSAFHSNVIQCKSKPQVILVAPFTNVD